MSPENVGFPSGSAEIVIRLKQTKPLNWKEIMMKKRQLIKILNKTGAFLLICAAISCSRTEGSKTAHSYSDYGATVKIQGLEKTIRVLHIADSHISVLDESEKEYHPYSSRMDNAYKSVRHYKTQQETTPEKSFQELMDLAKTRHVDALVLTGDIVNNPSKSSVRFVLESLGKTGIPWIYIAGNHDWHYEGMQGSADALRRTWTENSLLPLYDGEDPLYSSHIIGGINFLAIDNSTYQVNEEQLEFYKKQTTRAMPIVLLLHIPLYLPLDGEKDEISTCGDPRWGWDMDRNYEVEKRERWSKNGNLPSTLEFVGLVKKSSNLAAALVGHTHTAHVDSISATAFQYTTGRSADGQHRLVIFEPLN